MILHIIGYICCFISIFLGFLCIYVDIKKHDGYLGIQISIFPLMVFFAFLGYVLIGVNK